jgi:MOSC domain-containing protein YiiM
MHVVAVNVGAPREIQTPNGRIVRTAIFKHPVEGRVRVAGVNLAGDDQADRSVHGGPDKAVYAYASEDTAWWSAERATELGPGAFGENLTTAGVDVSGAVVGERWAVGSTLLEVCQARLPCFKLGLRMGDPTFVKTFGLAGRPGAYLRIVREGDVGAGDAVEVLDRPDHEVTVAAMAHAFLRDRARLPDLLAAPALPQDWRDWITERAGA